MWPWGHLGVAYLLYSLVRRRRSDRPPLALPAVALAIGSQFPDLVDKPLAWTFGVLPGGRTLAHSLFFAALFVPAVRALGDRYDRRSVASAFVLGYLSHLVADVPPAAVAGDSSELTFYLWPVLEQPESVEVDGIIDAILTYYELGTYEWFQFALVAVGALAWYRDGAPGLEYLRLTVERFVPTAR